MTTISSSLPAYTPPVAIAAPVSTPAPVDPTVNAPVADITVPSSQPATNANDNSAGVYTALANVSASTIRGTTVDTQT